MIIENRVKRHGRGRTNVITKKKLPINFDIDSLDLMCSYVISNNRNIRRGQFINLRNLIDMLDMERYKNDQEKYKRIMFIKKGIEARNLKGLTNPIAIIKYVNGGIIDDNVIDVSNFSEMSNSEIDWINETVSQSLKSSFIYEEVDNFLDLFTRFKSADYKSISDLSREIEKAVTDLNTKFRKAKLDASSEKMFSLRPDNFSNIIRDVHNEVTSKYRLLKTGMQGFNQLLGGGFENTRLYLLLGVTGVGKSMSLLNIAYQIKKYNKGFKPKDPTKIPCVVYLTQENTVTETVQRLFSICTGDDMKAHSPEEVERMLVTQGELYLTDDSPIDIIIKYQPNRSVDTSYLYTLTEDLEDEGYEVICMIQDHIKRIRSIEFQQDIRLELGNVANEMKTFAMIKDIPVITVSHLNRDGARTIDATATKAKTDLTRMLGKSNIGESLLMLDNIDSGIIINKEYDYDGLPYMVFKHIKYRIKIFRDYICQPLVNDEIKLVEDFYSAVPVFRESLVNNNPMLMKANKPTGVQNSNYSNIKNIDDEDNIYEYSSRYSSVQIETPIIPPSQNLIMPVYYETL